MSGWRKEKSAVACVNADSSPLLLLVHGAQQGQRDQKVLALLEYLVVQGVHRYQVVPNKPIP